MIDVSYYWFGVYSETSDLCNKTSCPVTTGDFEISHSQSLPGVTPPVSCFLIFLLFIFIHELGYSTCSKKLMVNHIDSMY